MRQRSSPGARHIDRGYDENDDSNRGRNNEEEEEEEEEEEHEIVGAYRSNTHLDSRFDRKHSVSNDDDDEDVDDDVSGRGEGCLLVLV